MNEIISKELLGLVLDKEIIDFAIKDNKLRINQFWHEDTPLNRELELFGESYGCELSLNLDTLTRLCKEWCLEKGYICEIRYLNEYKKHRCLIHYEIDGQEFTEVSCIQLEDTELQAVTKATEWVAKEKGMI